MPEDQERRWRELQFQGRRRPMSQLEGSQAGGTLSYSGEVDLFVIFRPSTDWMRPTHIGEGNLLYSVY